MREDGHRAEQIGRDPGTKNERKPKGCEGETNSSGEENGRLHNAASKTSETSRRTANYPMFRRKVKWLLGPTKLFNREPAGRKGNQNIGQIYWDLSFP